MGKWDEFDPLYNDVREDKESKTLKDRRKQRLKKKQRKKRVKSQRTKGKRRKLLHTEIQERLR